MYKPIFKTTYQKLLKYMHAKMDEEKLIVQDQYFFQSLKTGIVRQHRPLPVSQSKTSLQILLM